MLKRLIFWISITLVFIFVAIVLLISVAGYKINWTNFSVHETALVWLKGSDSRIEIFLGDKKVGDRLPYRINYVESGWKEVRIKKNGFYDWVKSFDVEEGKAYEFRDILFFRENSKPDIVTDQLTRDLLNQVVMPVNIVAMDGELFANDILVSRFSVNPVFYQWYKDGRHIIYQIGDEIRVIDMSGENDNLLVKLASGGNSVFRLIDNGKYLLYKDGEKVYKVRIR